MAESAVAVRGLRMAYGSVVVLEDVDLTPDAGEIVAVVADQPTRYPGLTVRERLELVRMTHEPVAGWCLDPDELIETFGLSARADASPLSLSSGQRQRLSLAAALARPSGLLLLDEPEQSLDEGFRLELAGLLRGGYAAGGGTVIMATHDHEFAEAAGARRVQLADGRVVGEGGVPGHGRGGAPYRMEPMTGPNQ